MVPQIFISNIINYHCYIFISIPTSTTTTSSSSSLSLFLLFFEAMGIRSAMAPARPLNLSKQNHYYHPHHQSHQLPQHHQNHGFHIPMLLILICLISIVLLFAVFLIILLLRRHHPRENNESSNSSSGSNNNKIHHTLRRYSSSEITINSDASPDVKDKCLYGGSFGRIPSSKFRGVQVFTYKEIEIATNAFSEANVIGNGRFGVVYRGILSDGTVAAIKMLNREGKHGEREFRIEVDLLNRLHSSYLVDLLGYCADQHHRILVFEFMPNGSLQQHLHSPHKQHQILNWGTRLRIALDCARALEFLHEYAVPPIIHRDLKSSNVVLDQNFRAKVSDLGLAKIASEKINSQISIPMAGPTGYLAPEYTSTGKLTTKSDVYSYGVVLLELITGRVPIDTNRPPGEHILVSWALPRLTNREKVEGMVDPALQGKISKKELIQVAAIAAVCVQQEAEYRPLMTDVVQSLIPLVKNLSSTCPSNSFRFNNRTVSPRS